MELLELLKGLHNYKSQNNSEEFQQCYELIYRIDKTELSTKLVNLETALASKYDSKLTTLNKKQWTGEKSDKVGRAFEELVGVLLDSKFFSITPRAVTGAGELDFLLTVNSEFSFLTPHFKHGLNVLCEAKCHSDTILESNWVARLHGLMPTHGSETAMIFSFGKSGKIPHYSRTQMHTATLTQQALLVIPIGREQVREIVNGKSFLTIVNEQAGKVKANVLRLSI